TSNNRNAARFSDDRGRRVADARDRERLVCRPWYRPGEDVELGAIPLGYGPPTPARSESARELRAFQSSPERLDLCVQARDVGTERSTIADQARRRSTLSAGRTGLERVVEVLDAPRPGDQRMPHGRSDLRQRDAGITGSAERTTELHESPHGFLLVRQGANAVDVPAVVRGDVAGIRRDYTRVAAPFGGPADVGIREPVHINREHLWDGDECCGRRI